MKQTKVFAYGRHAVSEALQHAPRAVTKVYLDTRNANSKLRRQLDTAKIPVARLSEGLARSDMKSGTAHQDIIASISLAQLMLPGETFFKSFVPTPKSVVVVLCGVQDPHNVGAIVRSAAAFGAAAVVIPDREQSPMTGAALKASAGAAFRIPLVSVATPKQAIAELKKRGCKVYALVGGSGRPIAEEAFVEPSILLLGNEGSGLPEELRSLADTELSIPTDARVESLNVAAAAAVALYAWSRAHEDVLG